MATDTKSCTELAWFKPSDAKEKWNGTYDVCYRHSPCVDGEAAEMLLKEAKVVTRVLPYRHGITKFTISKDVEGLRVLFVDCCPELDYLDGIAKAALSVT